MSKQLIKIISLVAMMMLGLNTVDAQPVADEFKERQVNAGIEMQPRKDEPAEEINNHDEPLLTDNQIIIALSIAVVTLSVALLILISERRKSQFRAEARANDQSAQASSAEQPHQAPAHRKKIKCRGISFQNIGRRKQQQDSFYLSPANSGSMPTLAMVADGMGGMQGGAEISKTIANKFRECYLQLNNATLEPGKFLLETSKAAEIAVERYIRRTGLEGGSTLVAALIRDDELYFLSVGDSRIYLFHENRLVQLNEEHTLGAVLKKKAERGEVPQNEPYTNPQRHALVAYMGMGGLNVFDRNEEPIVLNPGDKILICSDGVFNALEDEVIVDELRKDVAAAARALEQDILERALEEQDNFTGIILEIQSK